MRWLCGVALTLAAAGSVAIILRPPLGQPRVLAACLVGAGVSLLAAAVARARYERRTDPRGRRRLRFWAGALGRWLFRAAAIGLQRAPEVAEFPSLETPA